MSSNPVHKDDASLATSTTPSRESGTDLDNIMKLVQQCEELISAKLEDDEDSFQFPQIEVTSLESTQESKLPNNRLDSLEPVGDDGLTEAEMRDAGLSEAEIRNAIRYRRRLTTEVVLASVLGIPITKTAAPTSNLASSPTSSTPPMPKHSAVSTEDQNESSLTVCGQRVSQKQVDEAFRAERLHLDGLGITMIDALDVFDNTTHLYLQRNNIQVHYIRIPPALCSYAIG